jgi:hypothetical protein
MLAVASSVALGKMAVAHCWAWLTSIVARARRHHYTARPNPGLDGCPYEFRRQHHDLLGCLADSGTAKTWDFIVAHRIVRLLIFMVTDVRAIGKRMDNMELWRGLWQILPGLSGPKALTF